MLKIGSHISIAKGFLNAGETALGIGANTFQFFTRNPRGGKAKALNPKDLQGLREIMEINQWGPLFAHGSYTMNLASDKQETRNYSRELLEDDLKRIEEISNCYYIFHPGSYVKGSKKEGIQRIIDGLNQSIPEEGSSPILLEGMSGKGTEIGSTFEELKAIIDGTKDGHRIGICLDTCHLYSAGYDIVNDLDGVLNQIDKKVGLGRLHAIHLNDSKTPFASHKDRHEVLGEGTIGLDALIRMINHRKLRNLTYNLETPNELPGYQKEIALLREAYTG